MTGERAVQALFLLIALTLPVSALLARGMPRGRMVRLVLVWSLIFAVAALAAGRLLPRSHHAALHNIYYQTDRMA